MKFTLIHLSAAICVAISSPTHAGTVMNEHKKAPAEKKQEKMETAFLSDAEVAKHQATIDRVSEYLSGLTTIVSDFTQVAPDGSLASGKFFMKRPGKMRWQYNPPTPILIVADGRQLVFYDYELEQVSHIPLDGSLISFLSQETIAFSGDVGVTFLENKAAAIRIEVAQRKKPTEGRLMLEFSDKPLTLRSMEIVDATGQKTLVSLANASFGTPIDKNLFVFKDPRKNKKR